MDFMLIQNYLDKIPTVEDLLSIPEVIELTRKFSKVAVEEKLSDLLDGRHLLVTTAKSEEDLKLIDFSMPYYIENLKETLSEEREIGSKKVLNALGTIYSKYVGNKFYSKGLLKEFVDHYSHYNTLHYDVKNGKGIELDDEINNFLKSYNKEKEYLIMASVPGGLYAVLKALYKEKNIICSLRESYTFDNGANLIDTIEEASRSYSLAGTINNVTIDSYRKVLNEDSIILHSDLFGNKLEGLASLTMAELNELKSEYQNIFITDKVYLDSNNEDIKKFAYSFREVIEDNFISIIDLSKVEDVPYGALIVGDKGEIEKIKNSIYNSLFSLSKENQTLYYLALKKKIGEEYEDSFLSYVLNKGEGKVKNANVRVLELLQEKLTDLADFGLIEGPYLKVEEGVSYTDAFNRELLVVTPKEKDVKEIEKLLRIGEPSVLCWLNEGSLIFNLQLIEKREEKVLAEKIIEAIKG